MTEIEKIDAIVLAGAPVSADMISDGAELSRAMIPVGAKTMLQWVVDALRAAPSIGRIAAVGDVEADGLDLVLAPGENLVENIRRGIDALSAEGHVLTVSSDIPLLTPEAVEDFIARAVRANADMAYPILPRAHCEARYPGLKRTYLRTADGVFTGGNMMLVRPEFIENNWDTVMGAYRARKQVTKLARMIGVGILLRVVLARAFPQFLTVSMLERAASRMLGAKLAAVVSAYPEIGEDVDKPSDLEAVKRILVSSGGG